MKKLPKAPLQEVILEVKWDLSIDPLSKMLTDPGFQLALGKFHYAVAKDFSVAKQKIPSAVPISTLSHQPVYQFWKAKNTWPVIQLGPGIITINDTEKNYEWDRTFFPMVKQNITRLCEAYEGNLNFSQYLLRYIDVIRIKDYDFSDWKSFVEKHINFKFENLFNTHGELKHFTFDQSFGLTEGGLLRIIFSSGQNKKKEDVFILQIAASENTSVSKEALLVKINNAHKHTSEVFKDICKKTLYDSFTSSTND